MVERHNSIEDTSAKQPVGTLPSFSTQSSSPFTASGTQGAVPSQMYVAPMFQQSYPNASVYSAQSMGMSSYRYMPGPVVPVRGNSNGFVSYESGNNGIDKDFS